MKISAKRLSSLLLGGLAIFLLGVGPNDTQINMSQPTHRIDPAMRYAFRSTQTTLATMQDFIGSTVAEIERKVEAGQLKQVGQSVFFYDGADGQMETKFMLKVGIPVAKDQKPVDGFEIADMPEFESISSVYCGSMEQISSAYEALFGKAFATGRMPTGVVRETYLYWENAESPNDITLLSVQLQPANGVPTTAPSTK